MAVDRPPLELQLLDALSELVAGPRPATTETELLQLLDAQVASRHCDLAARWLRSRNLGYYTIGSSGHESNAAVAMALRADDPALLHYRSGAFYLARAGLDGVRDIMAGVVAAAAEPIAGGRHKVFGRHDLRVIPQTSTIASHLPRAVGVAFAIDRAARLGVSSAWDREAIAVCSFGDASANHASATSAINTALNCAHQKLPMPLLLVCEDNGLGISVRTPVGWIEAAYGNREHLRYVAADGDRPDDLLAAARELAEWVRRTRRPGFLHVRTVRFGGHAGTDVEAAYRSAADLRADIAHDPILGTARALMGCGMPAAAIRTRHDELRDLVYDVAADVATWPQLRTAADVMAPLFHPPLPATPRRRASDQAGAAPLDPDGSDTPMTLAQAVNHTLAEVLETEPDVLVFGEDVAVKGGVYGVTKGLRSKAGAARVFDTLLDETSILGLALGCAVSGFVPIAEIQYLAYLHNAEDQLRGEAATLAFFSSGQYHNGMVVRVAGLAYQEGFGGHFHNDDAVAVLRDIPGLVVANPARADDAAAMLRECVAAARRDGAVCVFLEPIARYHTRDLHEAGDDQWLAAAHGGPPAPIGTARTYGAGGDLTIITSGNGVWLSCRAAQRLEANGVATRIVDLRWLAPLPVDDIVREAQATGCVLVADETRASGGVSEGVLTALVDAGYTGRMARVTSKDSFVPLGDAAKLVLLSEAEIEAAALRLLRQPTLT